MCRSCGAIVGANEPACGVCGAAAGAGPDTAKLPRHEIETLRFARAILRRPVTFTFIFLITNIFFYLLMYYFTSGTTDDVLIAYGAKRNDLIREGGEWWRLVAPIFLHVRMPGFISSLHLLANMYGLWMLGPYVERLYGSAKFVFFWIVSGIAGFVASYYSVQPGLHTNVVGRFLFKDYDVAGAGASGALFGLIGVLFVFGIKFRHELPEGFRRAFGVGMLPTVLINVFIGYLGRGLIDNAGHMGGLAMGMLLALFVSYKRPGERGPVSVFWHAVQTGLLLLVALSFVQVWRHFDGPSPAVANVKQQVLGADPSAVLSFVQATNEGQAAFTSAVNTGDASGVARAVEKIDNAPPFAAIPDRLRAELRPLLIRVGELAPLFKKSPRTPAEEAQLKQLLAEFEAWEARHDQWVRTEGQNYGLVLQQPPQGETEEQK